MKPEQQVAPGSGLHRAQQILLTTFERPCLHKAMLDAVAVEIHNMQMARLAHREGCNYRVVEPPANVEHTINQSGAAYILNDIMHQFSRQLDRSE